MSWGSADTERTTWACCAARQRTVQQCDATLPSTTIDGRNQRCFPTRRDNMRACPFCAEQVQEAAIVCKHCGREIPAVPPAAVSPSAVSPAAVSPAAVSRPPTTSAGRPPAFRALALLGLAATLAIVYRVVVLGAGENGDGVGATVAAAVGVLPDKVTRIPDDSLEVGAGEIQQWTWQVSAPRTNCLLKGRIEVVDGGNKDIDLFVATNANALALAHGDSGSVAFAAHKATRLDLDVRTRGAGEYALMASNKFSAFTGKTLKTRGVAVTCSSSTGS
ncbi:hypothetical protein BH11GEM1_BH11GEM1_31810 [soil metagenome]